MDRKVCTIKVCGAKIRSQFPWIFKRTNWSWALVGSREFVIRIPSFGIIFCAFSHPGGDHFHSVSTTFFTYTLQCKAFCPAIRFFRFARDAEHFVRIKLSRKKKMQSISKMGRKRKRREREKVNKRCRNSFLFVAFVFWFIKHNENHDGKSLFIWKITTFISFAWWTNVR